MQPAIHGNFPSMGQTIREHGKCRGEVCFRTAICARLCVASTNSHANLRCCRRWRARLTRIALIRCVAIISCAVVQFFAFRQGCQNKLPCDNFPDMFDSDANVAQVVCLFWAMFCLVVWWSNRCGRASPFIDACLRAHLPCKHAVLKKCCAWLLFRQVARSFCFVNTHRAYLLSFEITLWEFLPLLSIHASTVIWWVVWPFPWPFFDMT